MPPPRTERHPFLKAWLQDLSEEVEEGWYKVVPVWLLGFGVIAGVVAFHMPQEFWTTHRDNSTVFYAAILTMNGIILALSWGTFAKIYETVGAPQFCEFLRKNAALDKLLFFVSYVHFTQIVALLASAIALIVTQFDTVEIPWQRAVLAGTIAFAAFGIKTAGGSVTVMHTLIRYRADFDADVAAKSANGNVRRL